MLRKTILYLCFVALVLTGCGKGQAPVPGGGDDKSPDNPASEPGTNLEKGSKAQTPNLEDALSGDLIDAQYDLSIKAGFIEVCKGEVNLKVSAKLGQTSGGSPFELPNSCVTCAGIKLDVAALLAAMGGGADTASGGKVDDVLYTDDDVIGVKKLGNSTFDPARPLLPSFLKAAPEDLESLSERWSVDVDNSQTKESGSGTFLAEVSDYKQSYTTASGLDFDKTMRFVTTYDGFENMKMKSSSMLLDQLEIIVSLDPVALPHLEASMNLGALREEMEYGKANGIQALDLSNLSQFESEQCGESSGFMKFMLDLLANGDFLKQLTGGQGEDGGGGILTGIVDIILSTTQLKIALELNEMEGLD